MIDECAWFLRDAHSIARIGSRRGGDRSTELAEATRPFMSAVPAIAVRRNPRSRFAARFFACRNRDAFNRIRPAFRRWGRVAMGRHEMDVSLLIGAPLGLGILLALGILMVAMSYL
jgi:hypothetical protein